MIHPVGGSDGGARKGACKGACTGTGKAGLRAATVRLV